MKFRSLLLILIFGILSFFFLDIQKVLTVMYQYSVKIYEYATQEELIEIPKEISPKIPGKPCIVPEEKAYYHLKHQKGYIVVIIEKVNERPCQALVTIDMIRSQNAFKYNNVRYYPGEKLWLPSESLFCNPP
jgi:hypothetical protein